MCSTASGLTPTRHPPGSFATGTPYTWYTGVAPTLFKPAPHGSVVTVGQAATEEQVQAVTRQVVAQLEPLLYLAYKLQLGPLQQQLHTFIATNMTPKALCTPCSICEVMTQRVVLAAAGAPEALGAMAQLLLEAGKPNAASEAHARAKASIPAPPAATVPNVAGVNNAPTLQGTGLTPEEETFNMVCAWLVAIAGVVYLCWVFKLKPLVQGVAEGHEAVATCADTCQECWQCLRKVVKQMNQTGSAPLPIPPGDGVSTA